MEFYSVKFNATGKFTKDDEENLTEGLMSILSFVRRIDNRSADEVTDIIQDSIILTNRATAILCDTVDSKIVVDRAEIEDYMSANGWNAYSSSLADREMLHRVARHMVYKGTTMNGLDEISSAETAILPNTRPIEPLRSAACYARTAAWTRRDQAAASTRRATETTTTAANAATPINAEMATSGKGPCPTHPPTMPT